MAAVAAQMPQMPPPAAARSGPALPSFAPGVRFADEKDKIEAFLTKFTVRAETQAAGGARTRNVRRSKYLDILSDIAQRRSSKIEIDLDDVDQFDSTGLLVRNIEGNTRRYTNLFYEIVDKLLPNSESPPTDDSSPLEVLIYQRRQRDAAAEEQLLQQQQLQAPAGEDPAVIAAAVAEGAARLKFPPALTRRYTLCFKSRSKFDKGVSVRDVRADSVGKLVRVKGMVTRVSNVKPLAVVVAYSCDNCGHELFQEVVSQNVTPIAVCTSEDCVKNNVKGTLHMQTRACKFLRFQEVRLQELTDQVPVGHIPRSMTVYLAEDQTRSVNPGEMAYITGVVMPVPFTGYRAIRAGLITDTYLDAHHIDLIKKQYSNLEASADLQARFEEFARKPKVYQRLGSSIAPEIFGHEDIKKALLLLLVGGVTKETGDGMKIRGDLNMCLMGDPGVAKSQLLKYICKLAPRAVYTTGRGSSGVGLTASVTRDPVTDEMVLEGGALVLADNGIACIDEFDKMDESDRTAIHEVMEQQTISISKAGITTTLNARTSILAAANPQYGRYNPRMKPTDNINLPAALLSRFDLLFLLLDRPSMDDDTRLAQHVTHVHMALTQPAVEDGIEPVDQPLLRYYISIARTVQPDLLPEVGDYLVNAYVHMRTHADETSDFQYTCARTLLSVLRIATAVARLRFSPQVEVSDVDEALRLVESSKASLHDHDNGRSGGAGHGGRNYGRDPTSSIYDIIKDMSTRANGSLVREISIADIRERVIGKGFSDDHLQECLSVYRDEDVWMLVGSGNSRLRWMRIEEDDDDENDAQGGMDIDG